jgi:predicted alpha/beta-fold hydrolase
VRDPLSALGLTTFRQRFPWLGPDLQTLRDTIRLHPTSGDAGASRVFVLPGGERLLARLDIPAVTFPRGLVVVVHGLGGGSDDGGQRRLARRLLAEGFVVIRLNLRGAGPGRPLASGNYAAACSDDLLPVLRDCRRLAQELAVAGPLSLGAIGISLGGTALLNALMDGAALSPPPLDALVTISSPLELARCVAEFDRPRNRLYQSWMVQRLIQQTLNDPQPLSAHERERLIGSGRPRTIREFDALITAPRWGFVDVDAYYKACSPLPRLRQYILSSSSATGWLSTRLLLVHAKDDPWVPAGPTLAIREECLSKPVEDAKQWSRTDVVITDTGGHCGFHAPGDTSQGRWSDHLAARWLQHALQGNASSVEETVMAHAKATRKAVTSCHVLFHAASGLLELPRASL